MMGLAAAFAAAMRGWTKDFRKDTQAMKELADQLEQSTQTIQKMTAEEKMEALVEKLKDPSEKN